MAKTTKLIQRRSKGDGSLSERAPGEWRLRAFVGTDPKTGKPRQVERIHRGTKTTALAALRALVAEDRATPSTPITVSELLDEWMADRVLRGVAQKTITTYRSGVRNHLVPALGHMKLGSVDERVLNRYYKTKLAEGLSPATVHLHSNALSGAFRLAQVWKLVDRNPVTLSSRPPLPAPNPQAPPPDDMRALINFCRDDLELSTALTLGALTGARKGELCGLRWSDVDWDRRLLLIARQRVATGTGDITTPTKGKKERRVALGPGGLAVLAQYRQAIDERAARLGTTRPEDGWLLSTDCGLTPLVSESLGVKISRVSEAMGKRVTSHAMRRFAATQMLGAGVDVRTVAGRLGNSPEVLLRSYAAFVPQRDAEAARQLEATVLTGGSVSVSRGTGKASPAKT